MKHALRLVAVAAAGLLTTSLVAVPAQAAEDDVSSGWLSRQLTDGLVVFPQYGDYVEYGMTADTAIALKAIGGHAADLRDIRRALAEDVDTWTGTGTYISAGSTAKAVVAAQTTGAEPKDFGGANVVRRLNKRVATEAPIVGRLRDKTDSTDYNNVFSQAIAARGLARAGSGKADEVLRFLLKQQCAEGYFRLNFRKSLTGKQSCDAGNPATASAPDTDATALAVLSLDALPRSARTKFVRAAQSEAVAWLKATQGEDGSFGGGTATEAANSNSTGLAAWALGATGNCQRASRSAAWVLGLQVHGDVPEPLAGEEGAIAYNQAALDAAREDGITESTEYEWRKATVDSAPALSFVSCA